MVYPLRSRPLIQAQVHLEAAGQQHPGGLSTEVTPLIQVQVNLEAAEQKLLGGLSTEVSSSNPGTSTGRGC